MHKAASGVRATCVVRAWCVHGVCMVHAWCVSVRVRACVFCFASALLLLCFCSASALFASAVLCMALPRIAVTGWASTGCGKEMFFQACAGWLLINSYGKENVFQA